MSRARYDPTTVAPVVPLLRFWLMPQAGYARYDPSPGSMTVVLTGDAIVTQRLSPYTEREYLDMIETIRAADLAFTNLEVLFHNYREGYRAAHSGGTWMAAEPHLADELVWAGFDMVSLANNHTMDYGVGGLLATLKTLSSTGLVYAGAEGGARRLSSHLCPRGD